MATAKRPRAKAARKRPKKKDPFSQDVLELVIELLGKLSEASCPGAAVLAAHMTSSIVGAACEGAFGQLSSEDITELREPLDSSTLLRGVDVYRSLVLARMNKRTARRGKR